MSYISDYKYYENNGVSPTDKNWGSYQYVGLNDIVSNFMLMYQGNNEIINNVERYQVLFHAKRGIQELNYDAMKQIKILQMTVDSDIRFVLPPDYVNYVRISKFANGVLFPLVENIQTMFAQSYLQDANAEVIFDAEGNATRPANSQVDLDRIQGGMSKLYLGPGPYHGQMGYCCDGDWYFTWGVGERFGLNTETANINPTFTIDRQSGAIYFSSGMSGSSVVMEYVSDGMNNGDDTSISVNKLFEEYLYAYIRYSILNNKLGVQEYVVNRARKDKSSLLRNAKIRLSNIQPGRLLMNMRGKDKWLK
jgi:hypothetical protein|tara:strand:+ start:4493 stop:5413 length:921 start_codon:yes stop_codon:yes gene_type:complete